MEKYCCVPFKRLEIDNCGNIYTCCPAYIRFKRIGNIYNSKNLTFEDIWYSKEACKIRQKIINNDYSSCNLKICRQNTDYVTNPDELSIRPPLPEDIVLSYDKECNIQCITCRDHKILNDNDTNEYYDKKITPLLLSIISNAKFISLSGGGEAFFSKHSRSLIKEICIHNKEVKFFIYTNGLLFNEFNYHNLGLKNRIEAICVSIQALDERLYKKLMVGSGLKTVKNNVRYMAELQANKEINKVTINTVISDMNYKEIPKIIKFAKELNISVSFSVYTPWGNTKISKKYNNLAVWEKGHKNYNNFIKVLNTAKEIGYDKVLFSPAFNIPASN